MADPISMVQFIAKVRHLGGFETLDEANAFITDANIEERGNANLRKVYLALVRARGHDYFRSYVDISTIAGEDSYVINPNMLELLGVSRQVTANEWDPLVDFNEAERHDYDGWAGSRRGTPMRYQLRANTIVLQPVPQTDGDTIRLHYVPGYTPITKVAEELTFNGVCGFEEWAIWETLAEFQAKDSADWTLSMMKAKGWADEVELMASQRNAAMPLRVQRIRRLRRREKDW
jgi:hypothetical protein